METRMPAISGSKLVADGVEHNQAMLKQKYKKAYGH